MKKSKTIKSKPKFAPQIAPSKNKFPSEETLKNQIGYLERKSLFCFRYYHHGSNEFSVKNINSHKHFHRIFKKLQEMSTMTWKEIQNAGQTYHAHPVVWDQTQRKKGFSHLGNIICALPAYQFKAFDICRIFGFFDEKYTFNIVWFDLNHRIYPKN